MTRPTFCEICHAARPTTQLGAFWTCTACCGDRVVFCVEDQHDYGGAVDTYGTNVWCCRRPQCGAILPHRAFSTKKEGNSLENLRAAD